jgi:hypothetical protein
MYLAVILVVLLLAPSTSHAAPTISVVAGSPTFFGASSNVGFESVSLYALPIGAGGFGNFLIDNVTLGTPAVSASPVPEPATSLLLSISGFALAVTGACVRRRRRPTSS